MFHDSMLQRKAENQVKKTFSDPGISFMDPPISAWDQNAGPTLYSWPFFLIFSIQTTKLDLPFCGAKNALSSGIWLDLEKQNLCRTMKWKYRSTTIAKCDKTTKNHSKDGYFDSIFSRLEPSKKLVNIWFDAELDGLQNGIKFILAIDF